MKSKFAPGLQEPSDGSFNAAGDDTNFWLPAVNNAVNLFASPPLILPTPALSNEAIAAQSVQTGPTSTAVVTSGGIAFDLIFDAAATAAPASFRAGIEQAASILAATITNKITVNINIDYSGTGGGAAAGPDGGQYVNYSTVRADLINNAAPGDTTFSALPTGSSIQGQSSVVVWNAQLKALGLLAPNSSTDDGSATFATDISSSLLVGVALHELTHALGRVPYGSQPDIFDFFRFTSASTRLFTDNIPSTAAYFSLDGGNTKLAYYGLNSDPSDFLNPPGSTLTPNDAFNEYYNNSTSQTLSSIDKEQLDALGFDLASQASRSIVVTAAASEAVQGGETVALLSGQPAITDSASTNLSSATIKITNAGGSAVAGDKLYVNGLENGSVGSGVTASWNASTDTLTLTGNASLAVYDTLLSEVTYQDTGTDSSTGSHPVRTVTWSVNDGTANFSTTSQIEIDRAAVATVANVVLGANTTTVAASSLLAASDADGDAITTYAFIDTGNGHFVLNGVVQANNQEIDVTPAQLSQLTYESTGGVDLLQVRLNDGTTWSAWGSFTVTGPAATTIEAFGSTSLVQVGNNYYLDSISTSTGPELKNGGAPVLAGEYSAWTPIGAVETTSGYLVAWEVPGANEYSVWTTDSTGNYISNNGIISEATLQSLEPVFAPILNGEGATGVPTTISTDGSTSLVEAWSNYFLDNSSNGFGPELKNGGVDVVAAQYSSWVPIGAVETTSGYLVAWEVPGANEYSVWTTDSTGNYISNNGIISEATLQSLEPVFAPILNGEGATGVPTTISTDGSTSLVEAWSNYFLDNSSNGFGPELKNGGAPVLAGEYSAWTPIGAVETTSGYLVAWEVPGANEYSVWTTDSTGNYISNNGIISEATFQSLEPVFAPILNGEGATGVPTTISTDGSTSLVEAWSNYFLDNSSNGFGPELKNGGAPVLAGEYSAWTPIGAVETTSGYLVAWEVPGANEYSVWTTDSTGNYISNNGIISEATFQSLEPVFAPILNGEGATGLALQYKGFDYVAFYDGAYENSDSLPSLVQTGANSIEATLDYGIDAQTSQVVADPNYTDSLTALGNTIAQAESLGLSVMVRPLIDFLNPTESAPYSVGDWRQDYQPTNVAAFFASYKQMIVSEAEVAQQNGAQMLSIGAELDQLTGSQYLPYWTDIINSVRAVFTGALTYSASWNTASEVSFWSQLNYEGIDCYVPLSNAQNPPPQTLVNGWLQPATEAANPGAYAVIGNQSPVHYFENLAAQSGKPLLFTELGYANDSGAAANPSASGNSPDPTLQAELYQAFFQAWAQSGSSSLIGTYFWEWDPNGSSSNVGPNIDSFSPQNSPAQSAATAGFETVSAPAGTQFGQTNAGALEVASGDTLQINDSEITNSGNIQVAGTLAAHVSSPTLIGTGTVTLAGGTIVGSARGETLHNDGNTILGTGAIGDDSGHLALDNASGSIEASGGTLILDTGATITNAGTLEGAAGATLRIDDPVTGTGGTATIGAGATLEIAASDPENVAFNSTTGKLILDLASTFSGQIVGFTGDGTLAGSDQIDLRGINYSTIHSSYNSSTGTLDVSDGTTTLDLKFAGTYSQANFKFADDGSGGTIVYDPPASGQTTSQGMAVSYAKSPAGDSAVNPSVAAGHDSFVFPPNFGQATLANFIPETDTIQFNRETFASANAAATRDDTHGNAMITDFTHDILTIQNITAAQLHMHQNDFHFI